MSEVNINTDEVKKVLNEFSDCAARIAVLFSEHHAPVMSLGYDQDEQIEAEFLSSLFMSSKENFETIDAQIEKARMCIQDLKRYVHKGGNVPLLLYRGCVREINDATGIVKRVNQQSFSRQLDEPTEEVVKDHKEVERVIIAYRTLVLEFNCVALDYNKTARGVLLSPLADTDMRPS